MTSRRELYAHGEPFGDSSTRRKLDGKGYICGFGGDSSSSSTTNNISQTWDNRVAVQGGVGISNSNFNTIHVTDGGIVDRALDTVDRALNTVDFSIAANVEVSKSALATSEYVFGEAMASAGAAQAQAAKTTKEAISFADNQIGRALQTVDATLGDGFGKMLEISDNLFTAGHKMLSQTQATVANAYTDAATTAKGTIDNRTMIVLAVAAAGALVAVIYFRNR